MEEGAVVRTRAESDDGVETPTTGPRVALRPRVVLAVEPDASVHGTLAAAVTAPHTLSIVASIDEVLAHLTKSAVELVVLTLPTADPLGVLRPLEELAVRPRIIASLPQVDGPVLDSLLRSVVDDVILKPFSAHELAMRIRLVLARVSLGQDVGPLVRVLRHATRAKLDAEIVVPTDRGVGKVVVSQGDVIWVHCPWQPLAIVARAKERGVELDEALLREAAAEAQRSQVTFVDVLASWGIAPRSVMEPIVSEELARAFEAIANEDAGAHLLPKRWNGSRQSLGPGVVHATRAFVDTVAPPPAPSATLTPVVVANTIARVTALDTLAAGVVHLRKKSYHSLRGPSDGTPVWSLLSAFEATERGPDGHREVLSMSDGSLSGLWQLPGDVHAIYARFALRSASLGLVLSRMREIVRGA